MPSNWDFPGGPVVKTLLPRQGRGFHLGQGTKILHALCCSQNLNKQKTRMASSYFSNGRKKIMKPDLHISKGKFYSPSSERVEKRQFRQGGPPDMSFPTSFLRKLFVDVSDRKESACNARDLGLIPGLGKSPEGGHGNPFQYFCLENPHGQRRLAGYVYKVVKLQT